MKGSVLRTGLAAPSLSFQLVLGLLFILFRMQKGGEK